MNFIFLRHSEYEQPEGIPSAVLPHPIKNPEGFEQAEKGARDIIDFIKKEGISIPKVIESSSVLRAFQTAKVIAEQLEKEFGEKIEITQSDSLVERIVGAMANLTVSEIEEVISKDPRLDNPPKGWKSNKYYRLPFIGSESLDDAGKRVSKYVIDNPFNVQQDFRVIIGHGASFRHASCELGILEETDIPALSMHYAHPLFFKRNKKSWDLVKGSWKIRNKKDKID